MIERTEYYTSDAVGWLCIACSEAMVWIFSILSKLRIPLNNFFRVAM
jgi:hypothetical protein